MHEAIQNENYLIIVMERVHGGELFDRIVKKGCKHMKLKNEFYPIFLFYCRCFLLIN